MSGKELISIAEKDSTRKIQNIRDLVFALLDCGIAMLFFIPLFGQQDGNVIRMVSLLSLTDVSPFIKVTYFTIVVITVIWGVAVLVLQNYNNVIWIKSKSIV